MAKKQEQDGFQSLSKVKRTKADWIFDSINWVIMGIVCVCIAYPLYYVLVASFTDPVVVNSGKLLLYPEKLYLEGYKRIFQYAPIWKGYANTVLYTLSGTVLSIFCTVPCAYALSRMDLPGRRALMFLFTFTMFFNGGIIPLYITLKNLSLYNTIWAMIAPLAVSVYNLIVCRSFFDSSIPVELLEASKLDGCSDFGFFFRIAIPLSSTIIAVMTLFYATAMWNQFMNALMYMQDLEKMPLQVILRNLVLINQASNMSGDVTQIALRQKIADQLKFGVIVVSAFPLLAIYPFLQKYFARGVMIGAVKG